MNTQSTLTIVTNYSGRWGWERGMGIEWYTLSVGLSVSVSLNLCLSVCLSVSKSWKVRTFFRKTPLSRRQFDLIKVPRQNNDTGVIRPGGTELNVKPRDSWAECEIVEGLASVAIYIAYTARFLTVWLTFVVVVVFAERNKNVTKKPTTTTKRFLTIALAEETKSISNL